MDLTRIDAAIAGYDSSLEESDKARLRFFRGIWGILDRYEQLVAAKGYELPDLTTLDEWFWAEEPIFAQLPPTIYRDGLVACAQEIAAYLVANAGLDEAAKGQLASCDWKALTKLAPLAQAASDANGWLTAIAESLADDGGAQGADMRPMVLSLALRSQLEPASQAVHDALNERLLEEIRVHRKSCSCPCCGTEATAAYVGPTPASAGNARRLYCAQCGHVWDFERVRCARCGTSEPRSLRYFSLAGDDAHRIHLCDECGGYVRTVFTTRESAFAPVPEVEDVVMAPLDAVALSGEIEELTQGMTEPEI